MCAPSFHASFHASTLGPLTLALTLTLASPTWACRPAQSSEPTRPTAQPSSPLTAPPARRALPAAARAEHLVEPPPMPPAQQDLQLPHDEDELPDPPSFERGLDEASPDVEAEQHPAQLDHDATERWGC